MEEYRDESSGTIEPLEDKLKSLFNMKEDQIEKIKSLHIGSESELEEIKNSGSLEERMTILEIKLNKILIHLGLSKDKILVTDEMPEGG